MKPGSIYWIAANIVGIVLFLYFSSRLWAPPGQEGLLPAGGDPIVWGMTVLPVMVIFLIVEIVWLSKSIVSIRKLGWKAMTPWLVVFVVWVAVVAYDNHRSYTGSDVYSSNTSP